MSGFEEGDVIGIVMETVLREVAGGLATGGVAAPAAGVHPLATIPGGVGVDGDQADVSLAQLPAPGVDSFDAGSEGNVVFFRDKQVIWAQKTLSL